MTAAEPGQELTEREWDIARLASLGWTDDRIGRLLFLSASSVNGHLRNVRVKTGAGTRAEVIEWVKAQAARRQGRELPMADDLALRQARAAHDEEISRARAELKRATSQAAAAYSDRVARAQAAFREALDAAREERDGTATAAGEGNHG